MDDVEGASASDIQHMSKTFFERIERGNNLTKIGSSSNPRDTARLIAAQARACVDCPMLQAVGPQSTNQALKAIAIARTYLKDSDDTDICVQPEFTKLQDGHTGMLLHIRKKVRRTSGAAEAQQLKAASGTDAKVLAGAVMGCAHAAAARPPASRRPLPTPRHGRRPPRRFAREGKRMIITAIGAGSINQAIKAIAIARQYVEEEAIDLCFRPEFVELGEEQVCRAVGE